MQQQQIIVHIHLPVTEKTGLAIIKLVTAALAASQVTEAELQTMLASVKADIAKVEAIAADEPLEQ